MLYVMLVGAAAAQAQKPATASPSTQRDTGLRIVSVRDAQGELKGSFQTRPGRYQPGMGLPLRVALPHAKDLRAEDGRALNGFGFYAWDESGTTHLRVLALVPAAGQENKYLWGSPNFDPATMLEERILASYTLVMNETRRVEEMKRLGMEPMHVKLESRLPSR